MTLKIYSTTALLFYLLLSFSPIAAHAQENQILSVTPPLFQLSATPGDIWKSSVKVVNGNPYPLTVYAQVVNFQSTGEFGQGKLIPIIHTDDQSSKNTTLAEWIEIAEGPHIISPEKTQDISFFVEIPIDAPPGGHYAAILISTEPPSQKTSGPQVLTSQGVTSLFFVRIDGDVVEDGSIREFTVLNSFLQRPAAEFSLRFENKGNVHVQPRGNIIISNMWGTQRGIVPINYQTHFGNVLPTSIRDFKFSWESDFNITDIGRYKAEVTLAYGTNGIKSVSSIAYFWVIPIKLTLITLGVFVLFITLITLMVKMYIRRMLALAGVDISERQQQRNDELPVIQDAKTRARLRYRDVSAPLKNGVLDLRKQLHTIDESQSVVSSIWNFISLYKIFFISILGLIAMATTIIMYVGKATEEHNRYSVTIDSGDIDTVIQGSEIDETLK